MRMGIRCCRSTRALRLAQWSRRSSDDQLVNEARDRVRAHREPSVHMRVVMPYRLELLPPASTSSMISQVPLA
jgi:hypothetical protein